MRVAVAAQGEDTSSLVDDRFGRAPWFVIVDTTTGDVEAVENPGVKELSGAGPKAAEMMARHEVDYLIAGHCGPNAFVALGAHGIDVIVGARGRWPRRSRSLRAGNSKRPSGRMWDDIGEKGG